MNALLKYLIISTELSEKLRQSLPDAKGVQANPISNAYSFGIDITEENDALTRKALAFALAADSGKPAAYENESGDLIVIHWKDKSMVWEDFQS